MTVPLNNITLDETDARLLETLQGAGRTKRTDLAGSVGLSVPSVSERLKKLEEQGVITGYHATVNAKLLGRDITAFIFVTIDSSKHYPQFRDHAMAHDDILECHAITGDGSYLLKVRTTNTASLEKLLARIQAWSGVLSTRTNLVLSTAKETLRIRVMPGK